MRKNLCMLITLFVSVLQAQNISYRVEGKLDDPSFNGQTIYIMRYDDKFNIDSTQVINGKFAFQGKADNHGLYGVKAGRKFAAFVMDSGIIKVNMDSLYHSSGTFKNDELTRGRAIADSIEKIKDGKLAELNDTTMLSKEERRKKWQNYYRNEYIPAIIGHYCKLIKKHPDDGVGEYAFRYLTMHNKTDAVREAYGTMGESLRSLNFVRTSMARYDALENTDIGKPFVDIAGKSVDGQDLCLSDYVGKGKYVLVDMWASWCGPCRGEMPNIAALYREYKEKGLVVLGMVVWDEPDKALKAMEDLHISWPQIMEIGEQADKKYGVNGIPHIILFAPDGTILARDLRGEQLKQTIDKVMTKK